MKVKGLYSDGLLTVFHVTDNGQEPQYVGSLNETFDLLLKAQHCM